MSSKSQENFANAADLLAYSSRRQSTGLNFRDSYNLVALFLEKHSKERGMNRNVRSKKARTAAGFEILSLEY